MSTREISLEQVLADLIAFPTVSNRSNLELIHYVENHLARYGIASELVMNKEGDKAGLHCRIGPPADGGIILSGHTDVVPVEGQPWDTDPFVLIEREGLLFGRGTADMKGFLACCMALVPEMVKAPLQYPLYLAFSYDEEVGCQGGPPLIGAIGRSYSEQPRFAIIGEPTEMQLVTGQKGIGVLRTTVNGSEGHSSRIREEVSAIHVAARLVGWLEGKMDALIAEGRIDSRFNPGHTTLHAGRIEGGIAPNVIAGSCYFDWDMRVIPADDPAAVLTDYEAFCREMEAVLRRRFADASITTEYLYPQVPALDTALSSPLVSLVRQLNHRQETTTVAYASEAGQFARGGYEAVICGPGSIAQAHRANEFISREQLKECLTFIRRIIAFLADIRN